VTLIATVIGLLLYVVSYVFAIWFYSIPQWSQALPGSCNWRVFCSRCPRSPTAGTLPTVLGMVNSARDSMAPMESCILFFQVLCCVIIDRDGSFVIVDRDTWNLPRRYLYANLTNPDISWKMTIDRPRIALPCNSTSSYY
jgi:hypothetical protein